MTVSVVIPTINRKKYVEDLLTDLDRQILPVQQVIVSDQSPEFINLTGEFGFQLIHFQHLGKGPCVSRNDAVKKATAEIIVFLDDDARIEPDFIDEITKSIRNGISSACSGAVCNEIGEYKISKPEPISFDDSLHWVISLTRNPDHPGEHFCYSAPAGCFAIKKNIFDKLGGYDVIFDPNGAGEDREMALNLIVNGYGIYYNGKAKLIHLAEKTGGRRSNKAENTSRNFKKNIGYIILKYLGKKELNNYVRNEINNRFKLILKLNMPVYHFNELLVFFKTIREIKAKSIHQQEN